MSVRNFISCLAMVLTGCLVPVDVGADASIDASIDPPPEDAGNWGSACPTAAGQDQAASTTVSLAGCPQGTVVVRAPDGTVIPSSTDGAQVSFSTTEAPGLYVVTVTDSEGIDHQVSVDIYERHPIGSTFGTLRQYVDRLDDCFYGPYLTDEGRLVCQRANNVVWVYEVDGGVHTSFAGTQASVAGNEIWSENDGGMEHRTDTLQGLRFDARLEEPRLHSWGGGETLPGKTVRLGMSSVMEFTWDGGVLDRRSWDFLDSDNYVFIDGDVAWDTELCTLRAGCQSTLCPPIRECPFASDPQDAGSGLRLSGFGPGKVWVRDGNGMLTARARPLSTTSAILQGPRALPQLPLSPSNPGWFELSGFAGPWIPWQGPVNNNSPAAIVPVEGPAGFHFMIIEESTRYVGQRWVIALVNPTTIRITPR
jgi:hypothetical protein